MGRIVNFKKVTQGVEKLLRDNLGSYTIERNPERNTDISVASRDKGWIGVYRGGVRYEPATIAAGTPSRWRTILEIMIEIQSASMFSGEDAEDALEDAVDEVITLISANPRLNNSVSMTTGYSVDYEYNADKNIVLHAAIITITAEVR